MRSASVAKSEIINNLRRVFQAINDYSRTAEKRTGLTGPQLWAITLLSSTSTLRVSDLARLMYLHSATVVGIVDRLESKGLVSRTRSTEDRRSIELHLTEMGQNIASQAPEVAKLLLTKGLDTLTDEQFQQVGEGIKLLVHLLGAEDIKPQPMQG